VSVRRTKIRVLLVERAPRWEFRHLKPLLERDEMIELKTVLQDSDLDFVKEDRTALAGFPTQQDELEKFDVVILGDVDLAFFNPQSLAHLRSFVSEQGGGLLLIAGEKHNPKSFLGTPLEVLCPVDLETLSLFRRRRSRWARAFSWSRLPRAAHRRFSGSMTRWPTRPRCGGHCRICIGPGMSGGASRGL
jgi:hypothetical protein